MNSPFEYQESLNSLHFTEEEKAAIARRAAEAARKQTRPARRPVRRIALIAAAAVLVLAVGASLCLSLLWLGEVVLLRVPLLWACAAVVVLYLTYRLLDAMAGRP